MIRVLLVIPTLDRSGAEKQFSLLATGLPRDQFEVRVVTLTRNGAYEQNLKSAGIEVICLNKHWKLDPFTCGRLKKVIRDFQPDIVHSWMFTANAYLRAVSSKKRAYQTIISERCVDLWKGNGRKWVDRQLISRTDCLLANSEPVAEFYREWGYPNEIVKVIPNGMAVPELPDVDSRRVAKEELLKSYGFDPDSHVVLTVGRLAKQKRVQDILWAFQLMKQNLPESCLFVVGEGPERGTLEELAKQFATEDLIRFVGHQENPQPFYEAADVFWLASEYEGMSNSLMEAMVTGVPVVVSDIPANRCLVEDGVEGYVVPVEDCPGFTQFSLKLLQEPELAERMGAACRQKIAEKYGLQQMVQAHAGLYLEMAGR